MTDIEINDTEEGSVFVLGDVLRTIDDDYFVVYGDFPSSGEISLGSMGDYPSTLRIKSKDVQERFVEVLHANGEWEPLAR